MAALAEGEHAIPASIMRAYSLGETALKVETQGREPRNRRVEITLTPRRAGYASLPAPTPTQPPLEFQPSIQIPPRQPIPSPTALRPPQPAARGGASPTRSLEEMLHFHSMA
jgi:hypothetical protein